MSDQLVENRRRMRRRCQVAAISGAHIGVGPVTDERAGDDAPDVVLVHELPCDIAQVVQALQSERLFVAGDLEHAVGRGVYDWLAGTHVFVAEFGDDGRARCMAVAQHAGQVGALDQLVEQLRRKRVGTISEISPVEQDRHTGNLPVAARRVLAARQFRRMTVGACNVRVRVGTRSEPAGALLARVKQSELCEVGQAQGMAVPGAAARNMSEGVRAGITERVRIGRGADAE